jgi:GAF domain-containing protein
VQDDRFKYSDLVTGNPKIRAYAGAPLLYQRDGKTYKLGTLCVIDTSPRDITPEQISLLETMAKLVVAEIEVPTPYTLNPKLVVAEIEVPTP